MTQFRYNSFYRIHKGLRVLLYDTSLKLQQTDLSDFNAGADVIRQVSEVLMLFAGHAHGEDKYFNEPIERLDQNVAMLFLEEHEEDHRLGEVLSGLTKNWIAANTAEERAEAGLKVNYAFYEFIAFNLYHMNKEEHELNSALWTHYTDEEIKRTEQELVKNVPPHRMVLYVKWMVRGINDADLLHWCREVKQFAPAEVFKLLESTMRAELPKTRFGHIWEKLSSTVKEAVL